MAPPTEWSGRAVDAAELDMLRRSFAVEPVLRLPPLATTAQPSSSSTAVPRWTRVLEPAPPAPAPIFKSEQICRRPEGVPLGVRPTRKWLLEPVLMAGEERWLTRLGAPPRRHFPSTNESLVLAEAEATAAVEEADRELAAQKQRKPQLPADVCVRRPHLPRVASKRHADRAVRMKACLARRATPAMHLGILTTHLAKDLPVKVLPDTKKLAAALLPERSMEVTEARYVRDLFGRRDQMLCRSSIDEDIKKYDQEVAGMAEYRQAASQHYAQEHRDKSQTTNKAVQREDGLRELQWKLRHGLLQIGKRAASDDYGRPALPTYEDEDRDYERLATYAQGKIDHTLPGPDDVVAVMPPVPRTSPCQSLGKGQFSVMPTLRRASRLAGRRRSQITFGPSLGEESVILEGFEGNFEDEDDCHSEDNIAGEVKKTRGVPKGLHLCLKPKQSLKKRMRRLRRNHREKMSLKEPRDTDESLKDSKVKRESRVSFDAGKPIVEEEEGSSFASSSDSHSECDEDSHESSENIGELVQLPGKRSSAEIQEGYEDVGRERKISFQDQKPGNRGSAKLQPRASMLVAFDSLSFKDQADLRRVFDRHDANNSDTLDQCELTSCLSALGLRGKNETEREEIRQILWAIDKLEVGFYEFATKVVPSISARLGELRLEKLAEAFTDADVDGSGKLSIQETLREVRLMGTFPSDEQVRAAICQVDPSGAEVAKSIDGSWLSSRDILDFQGFSLLIQLLTEITERERSDQFQKLVAVFHLDEQERQLFQHNLVDIHQCFSRYGTGSKGQGAQEIQKVVSKANAVIVIRECGLAPRNPLQRLLVSTIVSEEVDRDGNVDFKALLKVVQRTREHDRQWLHRVFDKYDGNRSGGLTLSEVQHALAECGVRPRSQHEMAEVKTLIDEFDEDYSGEVDHQEFIELVRFVAERLHKVQREVERQTAVRFGWSDQHFEELRGHFMALDQDASDSLDYTEMMTLLESMQRSTIREDVNLVLHEAGQEHSPDSKVDFLSFMKIMKTIEDRESQRVIARKYGFEGFEWNRIRAAFWQLEPNDEGLVMRDRLKPLLMDDDDLDSMDPALSSEIQRELLADNKQKVGFEVFVKLMKKKMDAGVSRRTKNNSPGRLASKGLRDRLTSNDSTHN